MCAHPDATRRTGSLRTISWGAAPATVSLLRGWPRPFPTQNRVGLRADRDVPVTSALPSEDAIRKIGSVGKPIPTIAARIVDER